MSYERRRRRAQKVPGLARMCYNVPEGRLIFCLLLMRHWNFWCATNSVSYTHLDVYKRQGQCRAAAEAALAFEHGIYSEKLGTWPDLRSSPVVSKAMHGLCSGAPGIGQALLCCRRNGLCSPQLDEDLERARSCCIGREPLFRDHLCCGNLSAVDFLLTLPDCRQPVSYTHLDVYKRQ